MRAPLRRSVRWDPDEKASSLGRPRSAMSLPGLFLADSWWRGTVPCDASAAASPAWRHLLTAARPSGARLWSQWSSRGRFFLQVPAGAWPWRRASLPRPRCLRDRGRRTKTDSAKVHSAALQEHAPPERATGDLRQARAIVVLASPE